MPEIPGKFTNDRNMPWLFWHKMSENVYQILYIFWIILYNYDHYLI